MKRFVVKGGTVVDQNGERRADVAVENGTIIEVDSDIDASGAVALDASGCYVGPGLVDLHTHAREPGREEAETIETASRAAVLGGYTAFVAMPNTEPATDCADAVKFIQSQSRNALCDVAIAGAITHGRAGQSLVPLEELTALGVRLFTDDGAGVQGAGLMRKALQEAGRLGVTLAQHCEDSSLSDGGFMHDGEVAQELGITGIPPEAEEVMVMRDIALARATGARVHFLHLSTVGSVAIVAASKQQGMNITAEAAPHHFTLTDEMATSGNGVFRVNPPLRSTRDREAVRRGLMHGVIDAIATDHAPWPQEAKAVPFTEAPCGMLGLQTALPLALELELNMQQLFALMSWQPAGIAGLSDRHGQAVEPGAPANLVVVDPSVSWTVRGEQLASKSANTPYEGRNMTGGVRHTVVNGNVMVRDGEAQR